MWGSITKIMIYIEVKDTEHNKERLEIKEPAV